MKRMIPVLLALLLLTGCGGGEGTASYRQISQAEAKEMMDTQEVIILDVREQDEYDSGHIPGAVLLPVGTIDGDTHRRGHPRKGHNGSGLLPQWKPQQGGLLRAGRVRLHQHL